MALAIRTPHSIPVALLVNSTCHAASEDISKSRTCTPAARLNFVVYATTEDSVKSGPRLGCTGEDSREKRHI